MNDIFAAADLDLTLHGVALFAFGAYQSSDNLAFRTIYDNLMMLRKALKGSESSFEPPADAGIGDYSNKAYSVLDRPLKDLELWYGSQESLNNNGINTIGQLTNLTPSMLFKIPNIDNKAVTEINFYLNKLGLKLKDEPHGEVNNERTQENT